MGFIRCININSMLSLISSRKYQLYSLLHLQRTGHCQCKVAGPDNVPCNVLKKRANQLAEVTTDIFFRISLSQETVPTCSKTAVIIPATKNSAVSSLNNDCPVALAPILLKCFEKLTPQHIKDSILASLDHHQYAVRTNRSQRMSTSTTVHSVFTHLEINNTYINCLLISAHPLTQSPPWNWCKCSSLSFSDTLDIGLFYKQQMVWIWNHTLSIVMLNTGAPRDKNVTCLVPILSISDTSQLPTQSPKYNTRQYSHQPKLFTLSGK